MDELERVAKAILDLYPEGLEQLIEFLQTDGAIDEMSDKDIRYVALMREGWTVGSKLYFGGSTTCGPAVGAVLTAAKDSALGREKVLELLVDTKRTIDKMSD